MKLRKLFFTLAFVAAYTVSFAQAPAQWRLTVKMTSQNEGIATVKAIVEPGWHIYGTTMPKGGPSATTFDFSQSAGIKIIDKLTVSPQAKTGIDKMFDMKLAWWDTDVVFRQKFKVTSRQNAVVNCTVKYMGCNNQSCSMPLTVKLSRKLPE